MAYRSLLTSFTAGEFSPLLDGRFDLQRFKSSAKRIENFIVKPYGGLAKIPGSHFVAALKNMNATAKLVDFTFNARQNYVLVFEGGRMEGEQEVGGYLRIMSGHGYVKTDNDTPYEVETPLRNEDIKNIYYLQHRDILYVTCGTRPILKVIRHDHDDWRVETCKFKNGPYGEPNKEKEKIIFFPAGAGDMEIETNFDCFTAADVGKHLKINDGDVVIKEFVNAKKAKVTTDSEITPSANMHSYGEELYEGGYAATKEIEVAYGKKYFFCFNVEGSSPSFGLKIRNTLHTEDVFTETKFTEAGIFYLTIEVGDYLGGTLPFDEPSNSYPPDPDKTTIEIAFTSMSGCSVNNIIFRKIEPEHPKASYHWAWEAFNEENGYPKVLELENRRLVIAATKKHPNGIWFSKSDGEREDFYSWDTELDTTGMFQQLESGSLEEVRWMQPKDGKLYSGSDIGIWKISPPDTAKHIAPTNIKATRESTYGSNVLNSMLVGDGIVFAERGGERLREYSYNLQTDNWEPSDLTLWCEHLLRESPIVDYAYQRQPFGIIWLLRADGVLCSLTYLKKENVLAVARHPKPNAKFKSITTIINDNGEEELWCVVERQINGQSVKYVEYLESEYEDQKDWFYVDSGLNYDGEPISTITGLEHLKGETVKLVGDGFVFKDQVVDENGSVKLLGPDGTESTASKITIGLGYTSIVQTQQLEQQLKEGSLVGIPLQIAKVFIRLYKTGDGLAIYKDLEVEGTRQDIVFRDQIAVPMDEPTPPFTGEKEAYVVSGYDPETTIAAVHDQPTACNITGFTLEWEKGEA